MKQIEIYLDVTSAKFIIRWAWYGIITSAFMPLLDESWTRGVDILIGSDPWEGKSPIRRRSNRNSRPANKCIWGGVRGALTVEEAAKRKPKLQ